METELENFPMWMMMSKERQPKKKVKETKATFYEQEILNKHISSMKHTCVWDDQCILIF